MLWSQDRNLEPKSFMSLNTGASIMTVRHRHWGFIGQELLAFYFKQGRVSPEGKWRLGDEKCETPQDSLVRRF